MTNVNARARQRCHLSTPAPHAMYQFKQCALAAPLNHPTHIAGARTFHRLHHNHHTPLTFSIGHLSGCGVDEVKGVQEQLKAMVTANAADPNPNPTARPNPSPCPIPGLAVNRSHPNPKPNPKPSSNPNPQPRASPGGGHLDAKAGLGRGRAAAEGGAATSAPLAQAARARLSERVEL